MLAVDFNLREIFIYHFKEKQASLDCIVNLPLSSVTDCYNMDFCVSPLSLYRHGSDGLFEIIWPEKIRFHVGISESLICRDNDFIYFSRWYEDDENNHKEDTVIRNTNTGHITENVQGVLYNMPDSSWWLL